MYETKEMQILDKQIKDAVKQVIEIPDDLKKVRKLIIKETDL